MTNRILSSEVATGQSLIDYHYVRRVLIIARCKHSTANERYSERVEKLRTDCAALCARLCTVGTCLILDGESVCVVWAKKGHSVAATDCGVMNARQRASFSEYFFHEARAFYWITVRIFLRIVWNR